MAKDRSVYICSECGFESPKWQGKCFECGAFNSFSETIIKGSSTSKIPTSDSISAPSAAKLKLSDVKVEVGDRYSAGMEELDSILNGGFVKGQVILLGGEPGVGKSTLMLQLASKFETLYVCGEESEFQVKLRAERLGVSSEDISLIREQEINSVISTIASEAEPDGKPKLVIVDSIQSVYSSDINSAPGNISQVQYCAHALTDLAKKKGLVMILIGQITKGGYLAGPKQLEHLVDSVLLFEGDRQTDLRVLRVSKNRFGATDVSGVFKMEESGFVEAGDILQQLAESRPKGVAGSVLSVVIEGNKPLLLEVQALNAPAQYGNARRVVNGFPINRLHMLLAVLERRAGVKAADFDMYVNISGGLKINDPALDLPICLAIASVAKNKPFPHKAVAFGEVGLLGEIKPVRFAKQRSNEAKKLKYSSVIDSDFSDNIAECVRKVFSK